MTKERERDVLPAITLDLRIKMHTIPLLRFIRGIVIREWVPHLEILRLVFISAISRRSPDRIGIE